MRVLTLITVTFCLPQMLVAADAKGIEYFETHIRPVLVKHCYECHSADSKALKGNLLVDSAAGLLRGGDSGPAISKEHPEESMLLESLKYESFEMPPTGKLSEEVIGHFATWLKMGAPDPRTEASAPQVAKQGIDFEKAREFWAFQPVESHEIPTVKKTAWTQNWIDHFVLQKLEAANITPNGKADQATLLRRVAYDLTGLPPSEEDLNSFLNETNDPNATISQENLATYVDRLLESPQFGEQWGRHWLDVARYADSNGGDFNATFHNAWRYRNYIIESFNADRPLNALIIEQIAGDLLPFNTDEERERQLVATGFLMMGTKMLSERDKEKLRMDVVDEQISTIGGAFLGMTMGCARCHDHKFDPIPTADYYAMAGILKSTQTLEGEFQKYVSRWVRPELPLDPEHAKALKAHEVALRDLNNSLKTAKATLKGLEDNSSRTSVASQGVVVDDSQATVVGNWTSSKLVKPYVGEGYIHDDKQGVGEKSVTFETQLPKTGEYEVRMSYCGTNGRATNVPVTITHADGESVVKVDQSKSAKLGGLFTPLGTFKFTDDKPARILVTNNATNGYVIVDAMQFVSKEELQGNGGDDASKLANAKHAEKVKAAKEDVTAIEKQVKSLKEKAPEPAPLALAVQESQDRGDCNICIRGEHKNRGKKVPRGFLTVATYDEVEFDTNSSGRLELAKWIADARHPLTARVYVNRVWQHLIGEGIVRSVDNFGHLGELPTHPELLDQLVVEFVEHNWSTKWLVREIILSHTYQLSSEHNDTAWNDDAENRLLWRAHRKRLTAEQIRDTLLTASGELDLSVGTAPMKGMGNLVTVNNPNDKGYSQKSSKRRTVYEPVVRNELSSLMRVFDFADPDFVSGKRAKTTVPAQALWMLNGPEIRGKSKLIVEQISASPADSLGTRVDQLYRTALGRPATDEELSVAIEFINASHPESDKLETKLKNTEVWTDLTHAVLASSAFRMLD